MDGRTLLPEPILAALARGLTIVTGNERAARTLRRQIDGRNRSLGMSRWEPPPILSWDTWTTAIWNRLLLDGHATRLLLNRAQEQALWRAVIALDAASGSLRSLDPLAEMAADAWGRLAAYRGEHRLARSAVSVDTRAFAGWAKEFESRCRSGGLLPLAQLEEALLAAVQSGEAMMVAEGYLLVGFDRVTPAQAALMEAMREGGKAVEMLASPTVQPATEVECGDAGEELATAARWMRGRLSEHPGLSLALIVPGLEGCRAEVDRVLRRTLAPEQDDSALMTGTPAFEFSLGVPLASTPLVAAALDLLQWPAHSLPMERVSELLLSPYFAGGTERTARAEFDTYELRKARRLRPEISLDAMVRAVYAAKRKQRMTVLLGALRAMRRAAIDEAAYMEAGVSAQATASATRSAADWADAMRALLVAAGWMGEAEGSLEFQTRRKWESVLDELATLDFNGLRMTYGEAVRAVTRLAQTTLFAPESRGAPVQVMGPLESAGSSFDAVWFLRAGDLTWPARAGSTPLLSWQLRRELGMPRSDLKEDAAFARRITERIAGSASTVFFSYARDTPEGMQRASSALNGLTRRKIAARYLLPTELPRPLVELETIDDSASLPPLPDRIVRGGASVLRLQAACGFRAFAEQRLWATSLDGRSAGMDPRERGSAVHVALEHFWKEVRSQEALKALTTAERRATLARVIETALERTRAVSASEWDEAYLQVQRERLLTVLDRWLVGEMERTVPFTVKLQEIERSDVRVGPLRLTLRVDRIDETEFGDVILDYKTGAASPAHWIGERPDEPQLPLYAILADAAQLAGVAFAQVRAGKDRGLAGYETQKGILPRATRLKAPTLAMQVEDWRRVLTTLAEDFHRGDVRVRPKSYPLSCEFCSQRILCRLDISLQEEPLDYERDAEVERG